MTGLLQTILLAAASTGSGDGGNGTPSSQFGPLIMLIGFVFIAYWFLISKPQQRQRKERDQMLTTMRKGDKVVTIGGLHGKIARVDKENGIISVQVAKGVEIDFTQSAISSVSSSKSGDQPEG